MTLRDVSPTGATRNVLAPHPFPPNDGYRKNGRRISTFSTQTEIGGSTDGTTGWQGRRDHRRQQRYRAGDRTAVRRRRGVRVYYRAPPERVGQGQSPDW